jgi:hypothetical protein
MSDPRAELLADVQRWKEAAEGLRVRLANSEQAVDQTLERLAGGGSLSDGILHLVGSRTVREMEDALDGFKQCRYRVRKSLTNAALAEGMTVEQLTQAFGVTPKMAAGFAEEDRSQPDGRQ